MIAISIGEGNALAAGNGMAEVREWQWYHLCCHLHGLCHCYRHPSTTITPFTVVVAMIVATTIMIATKIQKRIIPSVTIASAINEHFPRTACFLQNCRTALIMK